MRLHNAKGADGVGTGMSNRSFMVAVIREITIGY